MKKSTSIMLIVCAFLLGVAITSFAAKKDGVSSDAWEGVAAEEAAARLLERAVELAGDGSWENVHLARAYYLSGDKDLAEAIFDRYRSGKVEADNIMRIGRVYAHAGDWSKAKPLFDQVIQMAPKDEDWQVEIGAFYNLNGDREHAESLFARGFEEAPKNLNNALTAAGSYVGVPPRKR